MRRRRGRYGVQNSYAGYGLTKDRATVLLKECREGKYTEQVQKAAKQAEPDISKWIISSIIDGKSLHDMTVKWELGQEDIMPCCRNTFYAYRKYTLAILDRILSGKEGAQYGQL